MTPPSSHRSRGYPCSFPITWIPAISGKRLYPLFWYWLPLANKKHLLFPAFSGTLPETTVKNTPLSRGNGNMHAAPLLSKKIGCIIHSIYGVKKFHPVRSEFHSILTPVEWSFTTQWVEYRPVHSIFSPKEMITEVTPREWPQWQKEWKFTPFFKREYAFEWGGGSGAVTNVTRDMIRSSYLFPAVQTD